MSINKQIEKYLGRSITFGLSDDFENDVLLQDDGDGIFIKAWNVEEPKPELEEIKKIDVTNEVALAEVRMIREQLYPTIGDQLDMQYHDQIDGTTTWKDAIAKVKADNPKE